MSRSFVRIVRIASSSSRASASGHQRAPAASIAGDVGRLRRRRRAHGERRRARGAVDRDVDVLVVVAVRVVVARERRQRDAAGIRGAVAALGERQRARAHRCGELARLRDRIDQPPVLRALAAHAFGQRAEDVGEVVADAALVGDARQPAGPGQHAQQRHLRQRHRRRAVVDQEDFVAGECQLVAAARTGAVHGGEELEPGVPARILDPVARLVRELAEVHLPRVRRQAEHEDVRAGAEDTVLRAGDDDAAHFRDARSGCAAERRRARCRRPGRRN